MGKLWCRVCVRFGLPALTVAVAIGAASVAVAVADPSPAAGGAPTDGMFVIGDGNADVGSQVTFWGAQWWKDNVVSAGTVAPAFKGFAVTVDLATCSFTTTTGNSVPVPSGPLPASETVLVASSIVQSGSTVTGTIKGFATVNTNDGYGTNPGHAGTGTVSQFVPLSCGEE